MSLCTFGACNGVSALLCAWHHIGLVRWPTAKRIVDAYAPVRVFIARVEGNDMLLAEAVHLAIQCFASFEASMKVLAPGLCVAQFHRNWKFSFRGCKECGWNFHKAEGALHA